ncbi:MAG TPA: late competence development ComFB family protein [Gemmatimonadaceae bacterium]
MMKNLLESTIRSVYDELRPQYPHLCECERCETDVLAFALNAARPRYSGGADVGHALLTLDLQKDQTRATIAVLVLEAMKKVATNPRHGGAGG